MTARGRCQGRSLPSVGLGVACSVAILLALTGCRPDGDGGDGGGGGGQGVKLDEFCNAPGLSQALRTTTIVVDSTAIASASPEEFRSKNPELFKLVIGLANPSSAIEAGAVMPRERVTILAGSGRSGILSSVFTGCLPGASAAELAEHRDNGANGATEKYFGSDLPSKIRKQQADFTRQVLLAMMRLDRLAERRQRGSDGDFAASPFVKLLKSVGLPSSDDPSVRRLFVFSDVGPNLPQAFGAIADARTAGFRAAADSNLRLGLSEIYLVPSGVAPDDTSQQFLEAFMLGAQGKLERVGGFSANGLAPAPTQVVNYRGMLAATETFTMPMTLRLATTRDGQLVNSWISYTASFGQRATPLTGQFTCASERDCALRSDPAGGLGQLWRIKPGIEPEVREDAPFGGLRFLEGKEANQGLTGRIFDPMISIGHPGGGMTFEVKRVRD